MSYNNWIYVNNICVFIAFVKYDPANLFLKEYDNSKWYEETNDKKERQTIKKEEIDYEEEEINDDEKLMKKKYKKMV